MAAVKDSHEQFAQRDGLGWGTDADELRKFFLEYEATIGFRSTFSAMLAAYAGVQLGAGPPAGWDPYAEIIDKLADGRRVYQRLRAMSEAGQTGHVVVLYRLYGPRNARSGHLGFGEDAIGADATLLAPYTSAAADARDDLVLRESTVREERTGRLVVRSQGEKLAELEELFWREATLGERLGAELQTIEGQADEGPRAARIKALDVAIAETLTATGPLASRTARRHLDAQLRRLTRERDAAIVAPTRVYRLRDRIAAGRELMEQIVAETIHAAETAGVCELRARLGTIESTDREITVEDAIRERLTAKAPAGKEANRAAREAKVAFITAVRGESYRMRREAHEAYRAARRNDVHRVRGQCVQPEVHQRASEWVVFSVSGASP